MPFHFPSCLAAHLSSLFYFALLPTPPQTTHINLPSGEKEPEGIFWKNCALRCLSKIEFLLGSLVIGKNFCARKGKAFLIFPNWWCMGFIIHILLIRLSNTSLSRRYLTYSYCSKFFDKNNVTVVCRGLNFTSPCGASNFRSE